MQIENSCCFSVCSIGLPMKNCPEDFIYMMLKSAHLYCLYSSRYLVFYSLLKSSISPCITLYSYCIYLSQLERLILHLSATVNVMTP